MVKKMKLTRGVTLVEMMIVVAILGVVFSMGTNMYLQVRRFFFLNSTRAELQRDARTVMGLMTRRLRQAQSDTLIIDNYSNQPPYSRIFFTDVDSKNVTFYQNNKNLMMVVNGSTSTLAGNLRYMAFALPRSDDLGIVSVSMTLEKNTYEGQKKALHMASEKVRVMN